MAETMIFMSNGCEEVEALMVVDLLRRAGVEITMVSLEEELIVTGSHDIGMRTDCLYGEADFENCEMIILPGGLKGTENLKAHQDLNRNIKAFFEQGKMLAAICAAPTVFAQDGILKDKCATSYPGKKDEMLPLVNEYKEDAVVVDGNVITSRGLGTAIEFSAAIIEHFRGKEAADKVLDAVIYRQRV